MNLSENLHYLRKRDKITQEELADRLGVSRQSVSKWETGEAYPETEKLIILCDIFGVSLDALMRTDLTANVVEEPNACTDVQAFKDCLDKFSRAIALGVFFILLGVAICVALAGSAIYVSGAGPLLNVLSGVAVLAFVAVAVFLFIYNGMKYDNFRKENPVIENVFEEKEIKAFTKKFNLAMALLVSAILIDVIFLIVASCLIDAAPVIEGSTEESKDGLYCYFTAAFLAILAFIIGGLVYLGIQHTKYNVAEYNKQTKKDLSKNSKLKETLCSSVMLTATALFLVLGFVGGWWHPGWVVFPVGGIICGIIGAIMNARD